MNEQALITALENINSTLSALAGKIDGLAAEMARARKHPKRMTEVEKRRQGEWLRDQIAARFSEFGYFTAEPQFEGGYLLRPRVKAKHPVIIDGYPNLITPHVIEGAGDHLILQHVKAYHGNPGTDPEWKAGAQRLRDFAEIVFLEN